MKPPLRRRLRNHLQEYGRSACVQQLLQGGPATPRHRLRQPPIVLQGAAQGVEGLATDVHWAVWVQRGQGGGGCGGGGGGAGAGGGGGEAAPGGGEGGGGVG